MSPPHLIYWSPVTVICFLRRIRRLCIQIMVLSLSLVILLGFTWDFTMEETTHDSSSSSRKSEEKCPPGDGIKMKIGGFKTGHCYHKPSDAAIQQEPSGVNSGVWLPRLSQDDFDRVVQTTPSGLLAVSDAEGRPGTSKILRPQLDQCPDLTDIYLQADVQTDTHAVSEMRLLNVDKNAAMWNDCFKEHTSREDTCILPHFEVHEKKFGLCWQQSLSCTACHYKSRMYKLYSEVNTGSRGQKPCAPNVAIHVGLQDTTMGNTKLRHILPTTNTPPPSRSGMQRTSNRVATITSQSTADDLQQKREKTRDKCSAWSSSKCTNQYKHGCEVQLNIPEKQLRLWTECKSSSGNRD